MWIAIAIGAVVGALNGVVILFVPNEPYKPEIAVATTVRNALVALLTMWTLAPKRAGGSHNPTAARSSAAYAENPRRLQILSMKAQSPSALGPSLVSIALLILSSCAKPTDGVPSDSKTSSSPSPPASEAIVSEVSDVKKNAQATGQEVVSQSDEKQAGTAVAGVRADDNEHVQAGVGAALRIQDGKVFVHKVLPATPAARSNAIKPDDQVIAVAEGDDEPVDVTGMELTKIVGMIRGSKGTTVRLTIVPAGKDPTDLLVVSLTRGNFKELSTFVDGRLLPIGATAPNFKFTRLVDEEVTELIQLSGRIVVVEFWATWCGPCIKAVDKLESLRAEHPEWNGQVELVAVSVNEEKEDAMKLFREKQWSRVSIVWAGPDVLKAYRVSGLPTMFVIDQDGKVVGADHRLDIPGLVKPLLRNPIP